MTFPIVDGPVGQLQLALRALGKRITLAANPSLDYEHRATAGWAFIELDEALAACAMYSLVVIYGVLNKKKEVSAGSKTVAQRFASEPFAVPLAAVYNVVQVVLCGYMMVAAILEAVNKKYSIICNPFDSREGGMAAILHIFYLSKILDFVDTFVFVLRGKWSQFTFLHVYHHFTIFMTYWLVANAGFDGDTYYPVVANSFVHLVMYAYYETTIFNVKLFPWQAVTLLQMFQFITMMSQALYILSRSPAFTGDAGSEAACPYPKPLTWFYLAYIASLFVQFAAFFMAKGSKEKKGAKGAKAN